MVDLPEYMKLGYKALLHIFEETEQELRIKLKLKKTLSSMLWVLGSVLICNFVPWMFTRR